MRFGTAEDGTVPAGSPSPDLTQDRRQATRRTGEGATVEGAPRSSRVLIERFREHRDADPFTAASA